MLFINRGNAILLRVSLYPNELEFIAIFNGRINLRVIFDTGAGARAHSSSQTVQKPRKEVQ
jgi:hypothetical protein